MAHPMALASSMPNSLLACSQPPSLHAHSSPPPQMWHRPIVGTQRKGGLFVNAIVENSSRAPASRCIQPVLSKGRRAKVCIVAASSNEGDETNDSSAPNTSGSVTEATKPSISEKRAQAEAEVKKGQRTAIVTGAISVLLGVGYLVLIQLLDTRGVILVPPPPEAFNP